MLRPRGQHNSVQGSYIQNYMYIPKIVYLFWNEHRFEYWIFTYFLKKSLFLRSNAGIMTDISSEMSLYRTIHHMETLSGSITVLSHVWRYFKVIDDHLQDTLSQNILYFSKIETFAQFLSKVAIENIWKNGLLTPLTYGFFLRSRNIWSVRSKQF